MMVRVCAKFQDLAQIQTTQSVNVGKIGIPSKKSFTINIFKFIFSKILLNCLIGEVMTETAAFLELALEFQSKTSDWWWIAEEFFKSALEVGSTITIINFDDGQTLTLLHYLYGRFLQIQSS